MFGLLRQVLGVVEVQTDFVKRFAVSLRDFITQFNKLDVNDIYFFINHVRSYVLSEVLFEDVIICFVRSSGNSNIHLPFSEVLGRP